MKPHSSSAFDFAFQPQYTDSISNKAHQQSSSDPASLISIIRDQEITYSASATMVQASPE